MFMSIFLSFIEFMLGLTHPSLLLFWFFLIKVIVVDKKRKEKEIANSTIRYLFYRGREQVGYMLGDRSTNYIRNSEAWT